MSATRQPAHGFLENLAKLLLVPRQGAQGRHTDPDLAPAPRPADWSAEQREAWFSEEMDILRDCVRLPEKNARDSLLSELAEYHNESMEESYAKCIDWEALSVSEWKSADRSTAEGVQNFYDTTTSWRYDLGWHSYLQVTGHAFPRAVAIARFLRAQNATGTLLDFGSGNGLNGQVFERLGFEVTMADVSKPLLDFAVWRIARHGAHLRTINLLEEGLPDGAYDVITAIDTLTCVTDFDDTARRLHRALKPGGWLLANIDTRAPVDASAWHVQDNELDLDRRLKRPGFVKRHMIGGFIGCYQSSDPNTAAHGLRTLRDSAKLPLEQAGSLARRVRWPTPRRMTKAFRLLSAQR